MISRFHYLKSTLLNTNQKLVDSFLDFEFRMVFCLLVILVGLLYIFLITIYMDIYSFASFLYFGALAYIVIYVLDRRVTLDFPIFYVLSGCIAISFIYVQSTIYPDSYGTTHMLGSWTDDSFFFALMADELPSGIHLRENWYQYTQNYSTFIKTIFPFRINHPADVIFFQSAIGTILAIESGKLSFHLIGNARLSRLVAFLTVISPYYWMFGGVILIRDTSVAALFVVTLNCIIERRWVMSVVLFFCQFLLRPSTALLSLTLYCFYKFDYEKLKISRMIFLGIIFGSFLYVFHELILQTIIDFAIGIYNGTSAGGGVSLVGRSLISELVSSDRNQIFISIQNYPLVVRYILNGLYVFFFPFVSLEDISSMQRFDIRFILLSLIVPILNIWLNAWFITALFTKNPEFSHRGRIVFIFLLGIVLIGTYSMQGRHKTVLMPLFYILAMYGFVYGKLKVKVFSYWLSFLFFFMQLTRTAF